MDNSVPTGAARLLDLIGDTEAPRGYDTLFGNNQDKWPKRLTAMTVAEVIDAGPTWTKRFGSSAAGRYQFMNATLKSLRTAEALTGKERFDPNLQDNLGYALLDRRGYERFVAGKMSMIAFGLALAQEWASFPVLEDCPGAHRSVRRGETYYAGDSINKALISPETVEDILTAILQRFATTESVDIAMARAGSSGDADRIAALVTLGADPQRAAVIRERGRTAMIRIYGKKTSRNACAATLCCFLEAAGIDVPMEYGAGNLARHLEKKRGWSRVSVGRQQPGDVAVCYDRMAPPGADHVYLVVKRVDADEMLIADNQTPYCPRTRFASGRGQTAVQYFLRAAPEARHASLSIDASGMAADGEAEDDFVFEDQDTNELVPRYDEDGRELQPA